MGGRGWKIYAGLMAVLVAGYQVLPAYPWLDAGWRIGIGYLGAAAILAGTRRFLRGERLPWWCFAFGIAADATGVFFSTYATEVPKTDGVPRLADPWYLMLYPACAVGVALLIRRRESRRDLAAVVDATTVTIGVGLLGWIFVIHPVADDTSIALLGRIALVAYPAGGIVLLAVMARLVRGGGLRGAAFWGIVASLAVFLVGDAARVVLGNLGLDITGTPAERVLTSIPLVACSLLGIAAQHRRARDVTRTAQARAPRFSALHLALLTAVSMSAPAILAYQALKGDIHDGAAIAAGSAALFGLVVTRIAQLLRQVERQSGRLRELSRSDELTGLPNRRAWNDELPRALEYARRDGTFVSVAVLDLDHFKIFNDCYGYPAGDRLIKAAASSWQGELRGVDLLARRGGDTFIVLLPGGDASAATVALERLQAATPLCQTFSAGVATWDGSETSEALIARADTALYAAKAAGRNRIRAAPSLPELIRLP